MLSRNIRRLNRSYSDQDWANVRPFRKFEIKANYNRLFIVVGYVEYNRERRHKEIMSLRWQMIHNNRNVNRIDSKIVDSINEGVLNIDLPILEEL